MAKDTFASKVRKVFVENPDQSFDVPALALALDLVTKKDKAPLYATLRDFLNSSEICEIGPKSYAYMGRAGRPDIRSAMWAILRMRKAATIEDLQELSGASRAYAEEFIRMLQKRGAAEKAGSRNGSAVFRLVIDSGPQVPEDTAKVERLRNIRAAKRAALDLIEDAGHDLISATQKLIAARIAINDIPEGGVK